MNNATPNLERVFPLSTGSFERPPLRAPQLCFALRSVPGPLLGHRAFIRAWAARRAARALAATEANSAAAAAAGYSRSPPEQS